MSEIAKYLERAEKLLQKGKPKAALREYQEVLALEPHNELATQAAADLCIRAGHAREAAALLSDLFERRIVTGQASAAVIYRKLAKVAKPTPDQCFRAASLLEKTNRKEALEAYQAAFRGYTKAGNRPDARLALEQIVVLDPTPVNLRALADLLLQNGEKHRAAALCLQAATLQEKDPQQADNAREQFEFAYSIDPSDLEVAIAYARALLENAGAEQARKAASVLQPFSSGPNATPESRALYGRALLAAGSAREAEPFLWELFQHDERLAEQVMLLIGKLLEEGQVGEAVRIARRLEQHQQRAGRRREHARMMAEIAARQAPDVELLEYLAELFNAANLERDYCATLLKLFALHYATGNFLRAGECLERAAEVDPYEPGHKDRLEMLRGKLDSNRLESIAGRLLGAAASADEQIAAAPDPAEQETEVLEDLLLQAEILLRYSLRPKAIQRLERIRKLFPGEELKNEKLRDLLVAAGLAVSSPAQVSAAVTDETTADNISRVTQINASIARQGSIKSVLFTAVNEAGRHWSASRCIAVLCTPGKPPSLALEYCDPARARSDVHAIVKLVAMLQPLLLAQGPLAIPESGAAPALAPLKHFVDGLGISSLLAMPLVGGEEHIGLLLLAQCGEERNWRHTDIAVLKTIADQIVMAISSARLRSLVKSLAVTEEKSGLLKRSSYLDLLLSEVRRAFQQNAPVTVLLLRFGRPAELLRQRREPALDTMMQQIGQLVSAHVRQNDLAVRYDLSTLALVLADTDEKNALIAVDKLRNVLANVRFPSLNVGIAEAAIVPLFDAEDVVTEVINRAEAALDAALAQGGNNLHALAAPSCAASA